MSAPQPPEVTVTRDGDFITGALTTTSRDVDSQSTRARIRAAVRRAHPFGHLTTVGGGATLSGPTAETRIIYYYTERVN